VKRDEEENGKPGRYQSMFGVFGACMGTINPGFVSAGPFHTIVSLTVMFLHMLNLVSNFSRIHGSFDPCTYSRELAICKDLVTRHLGSNIYPSSQPFKSILVVIFLLGNSRKDVEVEKVAIISRSLADVPSILIVRAKHVRLFSTCTLLYM
jgi:hypothetical protein